ncbi:DUF1501 domain-containing protein [Tautonia plasticadhaerens]|uniref:DUF1501 domain-containing protein n=1 Tax=Tautonia plasticadhaerens TaxID=2527974 RepID=A0A518H9H7_9BACT|nr:DUF1501 domain-containing protein [Tautonia plasticadhaerens]QDV37500.1 hypothetical protein ElP_54400 [Tautonia plasticadhaerens]
MRRHPESAGSMAGASRRGFLREAGGGFGLLALSWMLRQERAMASSGPSADPLAPRPPHFGPKVDSVIYLFMHGGPSHLETFDPKPGLRRLHGEPLPESFGPVATRRKVAHNPLLGSKRAFRPHGESGIEVSDFFPHLAGCVDDLAVVRSCWADSVNHPQAVYQMNTGSILMGRPSLGSWVGYGLGSESRDLPGFVVLPDPAGGIKGGPPAYGNGFLPASYQGTVMRPGDDPLLNLRPPDGTMSRAGQRRMLDLVGVFNDRHLESRAEDGELEARIQSYELAFRMQSAAPEAVDLSREPAETQELYGLDDPTTRDFGARCLLARRLVERGVRFVQLYSGGIVGWDAHEDVESNHADLCSKTDRPIAALLIDLKRRGMLDRTLVIWGGEFGRMPMSESGSGRDHNPHGFTTWLAGGGIKGGTVHGATDPVGLRAEVDRVHVHDLHATILHLLGLDHTRLTFFHNGREHRLTDVAGEVITPILA